MISQRSIFVVAAGMLAAAPLSTNAHMIMANPVPYGSPNNSPLDPSGSDFPCKSVPYTINQMNNWAVGSTQSLSFSGTAVHGGGSCQLSVTTDQQPTKNSKWKVIHSFEGGCPAVHDGNFDANGPSYSGALPFVVPSELPNGEMSAAWTWFNKVGNREMYMNCAPIMVSGGSEDTAAFDALPDMAVANIGPGQPTCATKEGNDYNFEKSGKYKTAGGKGPFGPLCKDGPAAGGDSLAPVPQQPPSNPGIPSQAPVSPTSIIVTSTFRSIITVTAPLGPSPVTSQDGPVAPSVTQSASQPTQAPPALAPAPGTGTFDGQSCSPDGAVICNGDFEFGLCNFGSVVFGPVAAGTKCRDGVIAKRNYSHRAQRTVY
ncbi:hypothetical protein BKA66DRAFT_583454 [Pyrenochaeta sp. MPI-SDFR-AT-0127]|nr:hypothetical protein BKA66DRAFT_583454 [Pyrenochaeta sp. MPI-SDFR-AT-0127]